MDDKTLSALPTAGSLRTELRESLEQLKIDFQGLQHFVEELASEGNPASISLSKDDLNDFITLAQETQDAANDIAFEAGKIKDKLKDFMI